MEEPACAPTVSDGCGSPHSDIDDAPSNSRPPSRDQDLHMFLRYEDVRPVHASASTPEPEQQMKSGSTDSIKTSSPANIFYQPNVTQGSSTKCDTRIQAFWKTVGTIIGFFLIALSAAIIHYMIVKDLHGKLVDTSFFTQTQISAISVLLSTIFKAALTASIGTCFAQHLWYLLRSSAMTLSTVEMLFVIRTNILALINPQGVWRAPLLFLMALLIWGLGIATIYPAGALIVTFEAYTFTENHNMSVMNPPVPPNLDFIGDDPFPTLSSDTLQSVVQAVPSGSELSHGSFSRHWFYEGPAPELVYLARAIMFNNQMFTLPGHPGENSTYNLGFRGPSFKCTNSQYNRTILLGYEPRVSLQGLILESEWDRVQLKYSLKHNDILTSTAQRNLNGTIAWNAYTATEEQICEAKSALYNVTITFPRGVQTVEYFLSDEQPLAKQMDIYEEHGLRLEIPPETHAHENWYQNLSTALPISNEWSILDALMPLVERVCFEVAQIPFLVPLSPLYPPLERPFAYSINDKCQQSEESSGETIIDDCGKWFMSTMSCQPEPLLEGTIFHTDRFSSERLPPAYIHVYDPRSKLNLTEALLNEALANITISAISLGKWWDMVPVTSTRYRSTYTLRNPLNLILPYSICLVTASIFILIAIWSLWRNRASAADGGFLQIMLATVGNKEMNRIMLEEGIATIDDMSDEVKSLRVRYGELAYEDVLGVRRKRYGFGTADEVISQGKRR